MSARIIRIIYMDCDVFHKPTDKEVKAFLDFMRKDYQWCLDNPLLDDDWPDY